MGLSLYHTLRSTTNGNYLAAHPESASQGYLLVFAEHYDALSYLNTHAQAATAQFVVETVNQSQLQRLLERWQYQGIGMVRDPLLPQIEFLGLGS
ncbi:MAG: hypothetical protein HC934_13135 [Acaryochloridaceae cyanobacterium SU_2_1]|nr:hypothetical protein [Acaryochloridaceae cyanobacterium SU_2_1]